MRLSETDFWSWAFSERLDNTLRAVVAEFIVAKSLNLTHKKRYDWESWDLELDSGHRIEVKSSAYLQSWEQKKDSTISFGIARKKGYAENNDYEKEAKRHAHIYVFCLFLPKTNEDRSKAEPLKTDQWDFYVVPTSEINQVLKDQKTAGFWSLNKLNAQPLKYAQLSQEILMLAHSIPVT